MSFIFFGIYNFYIVSKDLSFEEKSDQLNNIANELKIYLINNTIKTPSLFPISKEIPSKMVDILDPYQSRLIQEIELVTYDKEELDPFASQAIVKQYSNSFDTNIKIYNTESSVLVDSSHFISNNSQKIDSSDIQSNSPGFASIFNKYKNFYINNFIWAWRLYSKIKYQEILNTTFIEASILKDVFESGKNKTIFSINEQNSIITSVVQPLIKNDNTYGVIIIAKSTQYKDLSIANLSFNLLHNLIILIFIVMLISIFYARSIIRPIKSLSNIANFYKIKKSEKFDNKVFPKRGDEIGILSQNFKDMSEELFKRINELEKISADLAHELKNPLSTIKSASELLLKKQNEPQTQKQLISIIEKDTNRMNKLITDFTNYTKIRAETDMFENKEVDFNYLLKEITKTYQINEKTIEKNLIIDTKLIDRKSIITGNYEKFSQAIINIMDNAISFSPKNSRISVESKTEKDKYYISIADQGSGIKTEYSEKIFERFYTDRKHNENMHSGLGLDIARHIIESYNGSIYLHNKMISNYQGACFVIELPLKEQQ